MGPVLLAGPPAARRERWRRPDGLVSLGRQQGSGLREPSFLVRRGDGQVVQLSPLLHLILEELRADRSHEDIADAVSEAYGRRLTPAGLEHVVRSRLVPLGLAVDAATAPVLERAAAPKANPLLTLRLHVTLLPERTVRRVAAVLAPLYAWPLMIAAPLALVAVDVLLWRHGNLTAALARVWATPVFLLALLGILTAGALVHELGHAAACSYGGGRPGPVGFGVYLLFPAFFTDVTDSYRLDRAGRLRTDLGGLYFNVWCLLGLGAGYLATGQSLLLLAVLLMHLEMVQQLVPTVRFDGYYVLADLAGVPDLFARVRPVLISLLPGREPGPRVRELRPVARRIVTAWVLVTVPLLAAGLTWFAWTAPYLVRHTSAAIVRQAGLASDAWNNADAALLALAVVSIALLTIPLLGGAVLVVQVLLRVARLLFAHRPRRTPRESAMSAFRTAPPDGGTADRPPTSAANGFHPPGAPAQWAPEPAMDSARPAPLTAAAFTDDIAVGGPATVPAHGWRRALTRATAGHLEVPASAAERRRAELLARANTPVGGSRRIVVMSRKGGVGKTTVTLALGSTLAMLRGDRVVAVDANPDAGNLAHRVGRSTPRTITDVITSAGTIGSYPQLRAYMSQAPDSRLEVLASDDDPKISLALDRDAYRSVIELLDHYYNLILLDTGTGILDSANQGLLSEADELVVVLRPGLDGARAAAATLDWLDEHRYCALVQRAVVVVNGVRPGTSLPLQQIIDHFQARCAAVVRLPYDAALESGARTPVTGLRPKTRDALLELAAAVAGNFTRNGASRS